MAPDGEHLEQIRKRKFPIVGVAPACGPSSRSRTPPTPPSLPWSAAGGGIYNVVDDEPAPVAEWLPGVAGALGAPKAAPRCRAGSGRLLAGEAATVMMTEVRGASNAKAKRELGWQPQVLHLAGGIPGQPHERAFR